MQQRYVIASNNLIGGQTGHLAGVAHCFLPGLLAKPAHIRCYCSAMLILDVWSSQGAAKIAHAHWNRLTLCVVEIFSYDMPDALLDLRPFVQWLRSAIGSMIKLESREKAPTRQWEINVEFLL